jgi:hypothetical protein
VAILLFWRGDHYRDDTDGGRPAGSLTLHQNAKAFAALIPGDRVWAFTAREDQTYVLAAQAQVAEVKERPGESKHGRFEMAAIPSSTVWYGVAQGADAEPLIRRLGLKVGSGVLGRSFRGTAAVKQLSDAADAQLERFASGLPIVAQTLPDASGPTRDGVLKAIAEYDQVGQKAFLERHGYWKAKEYVLVYKGKRYDSKAIYGVARGWRAQDFSGGDLTVRRWLEELGFRVERIPGAARAAALVLTAQEETSGGAYDFWEDETGVQYHFPNKYHNLVQPGLPFVYYRGVWCKGAKHGDPEYFGGGRIGEVWVDDTHPAATARNRRWFCSIEDYREFPVPVPWRKGGATLETIKRNQFRDGVRHLPLTMFERICKLARVGVPTPPKEPDLPPLDQVILKPVTSGSLLVPTAKTSGTGSQASAKTPSRRSRHSKIYGDHAELLVKGELQRQGKKGIRHLAAEGVTPGYDLEYREGRRVVAVEVKGTTGRQFTSFELTEREREAAETRGDDFQLWLVADLRSSSPSFEVVSNPLQRLTQEWTKTPLLWRVERAPNA